MTCFKADVKITVGFYWVFIQTESDQSQSGLLKQSMTRSHLVETIKSHQLIKGEHCCLFVYHHHLLLSNSHWAKSTFILKGSAASCYSVTAVSCVVPSGPDANESIILLPIPRFCDNCGWKQNWARRCSTLLFLSRKLKETSRLQKKKKKKIKTTLTW